MKTTMKIRAWFLENFCSVKAITYGLYQYIFGWASQHRTRMKRTRARWVFGELKWITVEPWNAPRFEARICDGMAEHYGYPRHKAYIIAYWRKHGYAFGVEFSVPETARTP